MPDDDVLAATGLNEALDQPDDSELSATDLLDATGQTQVLPGDMAVESGTGTNIQRALPDDGSPLAGDAETMMASPDEGDGDFEFASTEALSDGIDLNFDDLEEALDADTDGDDILEQTMAENLAIELEENPTESFQPEDMSEELSNAPTMTEVGTKLDLARAYVDMGDPGGAKSILEEVMEEGDNTQRQQAQQLLESLPG